MTVRVKAVDGDEWHDELLALQKKCLPVDPPVDPGDGDWWIAFDGDAPVGFSCLKPCAYKPNAGYLARAGVIAGYRGHGLQRRLIRARLAKAKKYGWSEVITDTRDNPPSANSLIACGFRHFMPGSPWGHANTTYFRHCF